MNLLSVQMSSINNHKQNVVGFPNTELISIRVRCEPCENSENICLVLNTDEYNECWCSYIQLCFSLCFSDRVVKTLSWQTIDNAAMSSKKSQDPKALGKSGKCEGLFCVCFVVVWVNVKWLFIYHLYTILYYQL